MEKHILSIAAMFAMASGAMSQGFECPDGNHPHLIDLGLPSGTRWACCNVGAETPEDLGGRYAWGETEEKFTYKWDNYIHCDGTEETCHDLGECISGTAYDVAHVKWGGEWRMPTIDQVRELFNNCSYEWIAVNNVYGGKVTGPNGNVIFIPSPGENYGIPLFSGTQSTDKDSEAFALYVQSSFMGWTSTSRCWGTYVRPVYYFPPFEKDGLRYNVHIDGATVEVAKPRYQSDYHGDIVIPETVEHDGKTYTVTAIESRAFYRCMELTSLKIPQTMRTIGADAFWDCDNLKTVDIGNLSNWCTIDFQGDWFSNPISRYELEHLLVNGEEVTDLVIPDDVEEISRNAFNWCPPIQSLRIPGTVKTIREDAFFRCFNIKKVVLHEGIANIEKGGLANMGTVTITIPQSVNQLGKNALNYENTSGYLRNVCLLNPNPDEITLIDEPGLESTMISVPEGASDAYKNHSYWGQFTVVEGLDEDDFSKGVVRVDYFYADEPSVKRDSSGLYAPSLHVFPGCQNDGALECDFALGLYQNGKLLATTDYFWNGWTFEDWRTCMFNTARGIFIDNILDGAYQMRLLYRIVDEEWKPVINSDKVYIDITVKAGVMTLRNRYLDGAKLHLNSFAVNGMQKMGHDMTFSANVTNEGIKRDGCLYLHVNDTVRALLRPVVKPQESLEMAFEEGWKNYVFAPQSPGTYMLKVVNGEGEVLEQQELDIPTPEKHNLTLVDFDVNNLYGMIVADKKNLSIKVNVRNDGDKPYDDELKFITQSIWSLNEDGDTLLLTHGDGSHHALKIGAHATESCMYELLDYDYYEQIGIRPNIESYWGDKYIVEMYYYSEGKEVLLAKTPFYRWINPDDYEGKILVEPIGYSREYGDEDPPIEYSVYGGTLNGEPNIYSEATSTSPAKHYYIRCERGSVTNENVVFVDDVMAVQKAPLTVVAQSYTKEQGEENPQFEFIYSGFKNDESEGVLIQKPVASTTATSTSTPGTYPINVSGGEAQNYFFVYVDGILTIVDSSIILDSDMNGRPFDVYNLEGQKVFSRMQSLDGVPRGVYIINGRKVIVK